MCAGAGGASGGEGVPTPQMVRLEKGMPRHLQTALKFRRRDPEKTFKDLAEMVSSPSPGHRAERLEWRDREICRDGKDPAYGGPSDHNLVRDSHGYPNRSNQGGTCNFHDLACYQMAR